MKDMYNRIIHDFFKTTLHLFERPYPETNITDDIITCINGRMYFCVSHWKRFTRYFPTFQKNQDAKNVYAVLHDENGARAWAMQRYVNIVCRRLVRSDFKTVQQKLDLMRQRLRQFQLIHLSELTLSELQDYYQMFHNTMIACWHYTLICVLNSRSAIQKLKKASKRYRKKIESDMPYQYAAGIYSIPPKMQKRLQKPLLLAKKAETYRKLFLKVHDQLSTLLLDLFAVIGQRLAEECVISSPEDVLYLTLQEALASIKDPSIHWDAEKIEERKMKYQCYCRMPNYTELVMQEEIKGQQLEMWTHMIFPSGNGKTQGRPCMPGLVKGEVLVLSQPTRLTKSQAAGKILVVRKMSPNCFRLPLLGLIVEEEQNYDAVSDAMHHNILFPVVTGVRGACALLRHTNTVSLNGWTGEIVATREKNDTSVQNKWTQYRKESS
jgi:phosphohistidine swiveling domain-containing protein